MNLRPPFQTLLTRSWNRSLKRFIPEEGLSEEERRVSKLILGFALAGGAFSILYSLFYFSISHHVGAGFILGNALLFCIFPVWSLKRGHILIAGEVFTLALILMFVLLSLTEGGVRGHAVAWLAALPICAMLLVGNIRRAVSWSLISVALVCLITLYEVRHLTLPILYPSQWHGWVTLVGYVGLGLFLMILGFLSEVYRNQAMQERDRVQSELEDAVKKLENLNMEKNEFLGVAAHDLNNPLSIVQGYAEMIEESGGEDAEFAKEIRESTTRMQTIIRDILDVNRIESGEYPLCPQTINVPELLKKVIDPYRKPAAEKRLRLEESYSEVSVVTDPDALHQVMENLVSNAVKYSRPNGEIRVGVTSTGEQVSVEIFNEGDGFTPEDLEKLFGRFATLSTRPTGGESSTGLGLSITQKILQAMGGSIQCESEHGQWALFRVQLPSVEP